MNLPPPSRRSPMVDAARFADTAFRRACAAVDDLQTAALMTRLYH